MRSKKRLSEPFHALLPTIYCGTPEQALLELKRNAKGKKGDIANDSLARCRAVAQRTMLFQNHFLNIQKEKPEKLDYS